MSALFSKEQYETFELRVPTVSNEAALLAELHPQIHGVQFELAALEARQLQEAYGAVALHGLSFDEFEQEAA